MNISRSRNIRSLTIALCISVASIALAVVFLFNTPTPVHASATDNLTGAAWSSNIGWINLNGSNYGVTMTPTGVSRNLSGYAWSSNIGWVSFNGADNAGCPTGTCQARVEWGTSGGSAVLVKGWARACSVFVSGCSGALKGAGSLGGWDGFISLGDSKTTDAVNFGVKINTTTGNASGFAWGSEVVGWVDFSGVKLIPPVVPPGTCSDGIQNQNETGIDTGGVCGGGGTCSDGIQNQNETGIDTGGVCGGGGGGSGTCSDGIQNQNETGIDTGGVCGGGGSGEICGNNIDDNNNGLTDEGCDQGPGGICSNIPIAYQQANNITDPVQPPYRKLPDGRCLCVAGYVLNPATFACTKPVYTEH